MNQHFNKSVEELQLGNFGYADEDDMRKLGWLSDTDNEEIEPFSYPDKLNDSSIEQLEMKPINDEELAPSAIFVNLDDRHLAIESLMKIYNQQSKAYGAAHSGYDNLVERHGAYDADRIAYKMGRKSEIASRDIDGHIKTLIAHEALKDAGFDGDYIDEQIDFLKKSLNSHFGPGHAHSKDREKLIKSTRPRHE